MVFIFKLPTKLFCDRKLRFANKEFQERSSPEFQTLWPEWKIWRMENKRNGKYREWKINIMDNKDNKKYEYVGSKKHVKINKSLKLSTMFQRNLLKY